MKNVIYALRHPETFEIRYIGFAVNSELRYITHYCPSELNTNTHNNNWKKSILPLKAEMIILEQYNTEQELPAAEIAMVAFMKKNGAKLTNMTEGGDGAFGNKWNVGRKHSPETIAKMSAVKKGKPRSQETKDKISLSTKGIKVISQETKDKISISTKGEKNHNFGKKQTEQQKEKNRLGHLGNQHTKETKLKMSNDRTGEKNSNFGKKHPGRTWKMVDGIRVVAIMDKNE